MASTLARNRAVRCGARANYKRSKPAAGATHIAVACLGSERRFGSRLALLTFQRSRRNHRRDRSSSAKTALIKHEKNAGDDEKRADPFQQPARITQNLHGALAEIVRIP